MISATIEGVDLTISGLESVGVEVREAAYYAVVEALQKAFQACKDTISLGDHSLKELALMGHPYGFKHPAQIHDPDVDVHVQSGEYLASLKARPPIGMATAIIEGSIVNESPLDRWIQEGTDKMRARPWMQYIVDTYGEDFADLIQARILAAAQAAA
jgi:hypothetical protein